MQIRVFQKMFRILTDVFTVKLVLTTIITVIVLFILLYESITR